MRLVACSIRDAAAEAWLTPMFFQSKGQAVRSFTDAVNSQEGDFGKHPEDYTLFAIGEFDPDSGTLVVYKDGPASLGVGVNFVREVR